MGIFRVIENQISFVNELSPYKNAFWSYILHNLKLIRIFIKLTKDSRNHWNYSH